MESFPLGADPVTDATGERCADNQPTDGIWFLAGTFGGTAERTCEIPAGARLYFPVLNQICLADKSQETTRALNDCSSAADTQSASLDGNPLVVEEATSEGVFTFETRSGTVGFPPGRHGAVASGLWVGPLAVPAGDHTLKFSGRAGSFELDVTYRLKVGR